MDAIITDLQIPVKMRICPLLTLLLHCLKIALLFSQPAIATEIASSPTSFTSTSPNPTAITLTWTQPPGDVVDEFVITYSFQETDCGFSGTNIIRRVDGSMREVELTNLEENSDYTFHIVASNEAGDSPQVTTTETTSPASPTAPPSNLRIASTTPISITIRWDRVPCEDRNVDVSEYIGRYGPNLQIRAFGTRQSQRVFTANGLVPRTSYTFELEAFHLDVVRLIPYQGPASTVTGTTATPTDIGFYLNGMLYSNNSVVALADIGEETDIGGDDTALFCLTDLGACCRAIDGGLAGGWFLAGQTEEAVVDIDVATNADTFTVSRGPSAVRLNRVGNAQGPTGIYTCQIPDGSGLRTAYIGVNTGSPQVIALEYDVTNLTLTCTSTGGTVASVTWKRDGAQVGSEFSQMQTITDTLSATYKHTLSSEDAANFVGSLTCEVRGPTGSMDQRTQFVNGVTVTSDQFSVGQRAVVTCSSDSGVVESIEWQSEGQVLANATSVQQLGLVLDPVNDTIHGSVITCVVTRGNSIVNQSLSINVAVPPNPLSATVADIGVRAAGSEFSLDCIISEAISGLADMPTAMWMDDSRVTIITTGGDLSVSTSRNETVAVATLTFNPLRSSHGEGGVIYVCSGNIMSPAEDGLLRVSVDRRLTVQISTPAVSLSVAPGPLLVGVLRDTTLTCSATVDPNVLDTSQAIFYRFRWRNRVEITSGGRITINQPSMTTSTSTLTLSSLTTMDNIITCTVVVTVNQGVLVPSDLGMASITLDIQIPDVFEVDIERIGPSTAGDTCSFNCNITLLQQLAATPTISWMNSNGVVDSNTLLNVTLARPSPLFGMLTFAPLRTSHGGGYWCVVSVEVEDGFFLTSSSSTLNITVEIPQPNIAITGTPLDSRFHNGLALTFIARAEFNPAVDTALNVNGMWTAPDDDSARVSVVPPVLVQNSPTVYVSNYSLTLDMERDGGGYTLSLVISSVPFTIGVSASSSRTIDITDFPPQIVDISPLVENIPTAGDQYTLQCNISRSFTIDSSTTLAVMWLDPLNNTVISSSDVSLSTSTSDPTSITITSTLTFPRLRTSQGGVYKCVANMTIPGVVTDHVVSTSAQVIVAIPVATSVTFALSREGTLYVGTSVNIVCSVTVDKNLVNTEIMAVFSFTRSPEDPNRVFSPSNMRGNSSTFSGVARFPVLLPSDNETQIACVSTLRPEENLQFVREVENPTEQQQLQLQSLPPPDVSVTAVPLTLAGDSISLNCTATFIDNLVMTPDLRWLDPENSVINTVETTESGMRVVRLGPLRTSDGGPYTCEATLNIPGIPSVRATASTNVRVQIPAPQVSTMLLGDAVAGTTGTSLSGAVSVNPLVDTAVSSSEEWRRVGQTEPSSTTNTLMFVPLSSTDAGDYVYTATITPSDTTYVVASSNSDTLSLTVQPYPPLVVSRAVLSGECTLGGGMTTLTGNVSLHINTHRDYSLAYMWRDPERSVITESSGSDLTVVENRLIVNNVGSNEGDYGLTVCITISDSDVTNHCSQEVTYSVSSAEPNQVSGLMCPPSPSASELRVSWSLPTVNADNINDYVVEVLQYVQPSNSRMLELVNLSPPFRREVTVLEESVLQGVGSGVPYQVKVTTRNLAGCGQLRTIDCFTEEGIPTVVPGAVRVNYSTEGIVISWQRLTLVEAKGFIQYLIELRPHMSSSERQPISMQVHMDQNSTTFTGVDPTQSYNVSVATVTSEGEVGQSSPVLSIFTQIPVPTITITASPVQSNFYTGLQLTLTCIAELEMPMGYRVNVSAKWSKSGSTLATNSRVIVGEGPVEVEPFVYEIGLTFRSLNKSRGDNGEYTCTVSLDPIGSPLHRAVTIAMTKRIQVETSLFQLRILGVGDCENWRASSNVGDIIQAIINEVLNRCGCTFTEDHITQEGFLCFASSPDAVTYRAELHGTREATVEDLLQDIQQWIQGGISLPGMLTVDSTCDVRIRSFTDTECRDRRSKGSKEFTTAGTIVAAVVGVSIVLKINY